MAKYIVRQSFRFAGKHYKVSKKQVTLEGDVAKFALDNSLAIDPALEKEKARTKAKAVEEAEIKEKAEEEAEAKAAEAEAENNKNLGNAPENK